MTFRKIIMFIPYPHHPPCPLSVLLCLSLCVSLSLSLSVSFLSLVRCLAWSVSHRCLCLLLSVLPLSEPGTHAHERGEPILSAAREFATALMEHQRGRCVYVCVCVRQCVSVCVSMCVNVCLCVSMCVCLRAGVCGGGVIAGWGYGGLGGGGGIGGVGSPLVTELKPGQKEWWSRAKRTPPPLKNQMSTLI